MNHESPVYKDTQKSKTLLLSLLSPCIVEIFQSDLRIQASPLIERFNMWWEALHSNIFYYSKHIHSLTGVLHLVLSIVYKFSLYLTENTPYLPYKKQSVNVNKKVQLDATVCRHLFTAKSLYMFRASQHPSSGALKTVTATSGIGHNTGIATSFQREGPDQTTLEGSNCTSVMTYTRGCGYSF